MVGMIVLVMAGVGLSIVVDHRLKFSSGHSAAQKEVRTGDEIMGDLKNQHEERSTLLANSSDKRHSRLLAFDELTRESESLKKKQALMVAKQQALTAAVSQLEADALRYRAEYRQNSWTRAAGENLGNLKLKSGREYESVTITRVTEAGLEISHENGFSRIPALELDPKLRDRFQIGLTNRQNPQKTEPELSENPQQGR